MAVERRQTMYPFAEMIEVETNGTTAVSFFPIPANTIIEKVLCKVKTASTNAVNLTIGDEDDADGFIVASAANSANAVYGDSVDEIGAYLKEQVSDSGSATHNQPIPGGKLYTADKNMKIVLSGAAGSQEAVVQVFVKGLKYAN